MMNLRSFCLGVALLVAGTASAWAAPLNGSFTFNGDNLTFNPAIGTTAFNAYNGTASFNPTTPGSQAATGDFVAQEPSYGVAQTNSLAMFADGSGPTALTWDFGGYGSFTGTITVDGYGIGASFYTASFDGVFTPNFGGLAPSTANLTFSFSRSVVGQNATYSLSGTLVAAGQAVTVPEPGSIALAAFGALALGVVARRRRA